jgi:hypothetical protein
MSIKNEKKIFNQKCDLKLTLHWTLSEDVAATTRSWLLDSDSHSSGLELVCLILKFFELNTDIIKVLVDFVSFLSLDLLKSQL